MVNELDEALTECGFILDGSGIAKLESRVAIEVESGPMGFCWVRLKFENGKELHTTFDCDEDIEDAFPWKQFVETHHD